ncbi:ABC transporter permease [Halegenticoccus soli]|uniref:ABC transporter permease n=1 Tax=Halegenticoccus soli TaxID=1985678 RepID=UPI000C6E1A81|nr:ABC transporter permease [Halegenticoccus soli]
MSTITDIGPSASLPLTRSQRVKAARGAIVLGFLAFVEFGPTVGLVDPTTLIPLSAMLGELWTLLSTGALEPHVVQTFSAVFGAFALALLTGVPGGVLLWKVETLKEILDPYLLIYYAVPFFAFYPLLISIMGLGIAPIVAIAWGFSVVIVVTNTASGLAEIPEVYVKAGRDMNLTPRQLLQHVYFPAAVPYVFTGLKLGFIYALIGTIASEFILADSGLGWLISFNYDNFDVRGMYAAMLLVVLLALAVNGLLIAIEKRLYRRVRA